MCALICMISALPVNEGMVRSNHAAVLVVVAVVRSDFPEGSLIAQDMLISPCHVYFITR